MMCCKIDILFSKGNIIDRAVSVSWISTGICANCLLCSCALHNEVSVVHL
ncbi:hypothetical protein DAI22_08g096200 [Oryza sativa Japonica Group]|nr:hypothetical protein DAI22_08g096200 [Oryza sativa Japonica Group]